MLRRGCVREFLCGTEWFFHIRVDDGSSSGLLLQHARGMVKKISAANRFFLSLFLAISITKNNQIHH